MHKLSRKEGMTRKNAKIPEKASLYDKYRSLGWTEMTRNYEIANSK